MTVTNTAAAGQMEPGQNLDRFHLDALIAESATARIFRATDAHSGHTVAIRVPHVSLAADPSAVDCFHRAEQIGASIHHDNVMRVYPQHRRSRLYIVMEWCEGQPLSELLKTTASLPPQRAIRIAVAVLRALEHLHGHSVVHRDLRPEHIMVDDSDRIKLIDFGVAVRPGGRSLTLSGFIRILASPAYIAPEQVRGKRGDARSDLYSLGIILFEMLAGHTPFSGRSPEATMNARLKRSIPPLRLPDFPLAAQLQETLCRATEREPRHRYASAREFALDLENLSRVGVSERPELARRSRGSVTSRVLLYSVIAVLLISPFLLIALLSRHR